MTNRASFDLQRGVLSDDGISNVDRRRSACVSRKFDGTIRVGDRCRGSMPRGKSNNVHDNIDAKLKA